MRFFKKVSETPECVYYIYNCTNHDTKHTDKLKITKNSLSVEIVKLAEDDNSAKESKNSAITLSKAKYPVKYFYCSEI